MRRRSVGRQSGRGRGGWAGWLVRVVNRFRHEKGTERERVRPQQPIILIGFSLSLSLWLSLNLSYLSLG